MGKGRIEGSLFLPAAQATPAPALPSVGQPLPMAAALTHAVPLLSLHAPLGSLLYPPLVPHHALLAF